MNSTTRKISYLNIIHCVYHPMAALIEDHHTGDMICSVCGLIVGDRIIDPSCEWRTFCNQPSKVDPSRIGGTENCLFPDGTLSTTIESGTEFCFKYSPRRDSFSRMLITGFAAIDAMTERINTTKSIVRQAKVIFKQVQVEDNLKYRSIDAKASACLYIACRQEGVPRSFKEICAVSTVCKKEIGRCFKLIVKALSSSLEHITSEDFMSRFCANLYLSLDVQKTATRIAKTTFQMSIADGRSPISIAAAAIYMASQASRNKKSFKEVGDIAGVAECTIRQCYNEMCVHIGTLLPARDFVIPMIQL